VERGTSSMLHAVHLGQLSVRSLDEYEHAAYTIATTPALAAELKQHLAAVRSTAPLFDTAMWVRHWEQAIAMMAALEHVGRRPQHVIVRAIRKR